MRCEKFVQNNCEEYYETRILLEYCTERNNCRNCHAQNFMEIQYKIGFEYLISGVELLYAGQDAYKTCQERKMLSNFVTTLL